MASLARARLFKPRNVDESEPLLASAARKRLGRGKPWARASFGALIVALGCTLGWIGATDPRGLYVGVVARMNQALGTRTRSITFRVFTCGIPEAIYNAHIPWPICRVKLVGCPGGGASCYHWRYAKGLEMAPLSDKRDVWELTTDKFGTGDVFGFAVIEAGCNVADEAACTAGRDGKCKDNNMCDHRYDSGLQRATTHKHANITCWAENAPKDRGYRCASHSPFFNLQHGQDKCFRKMGEWYNRIVPPKTSVVSFVWGTCLHEPTGADGLCAADAPGLCTLLDTVDPSGGIIQAPLGQCSLPDGSDADGIACKITHAAPNSKEYSVEGSCCRGSCCADGNVCSTTNKQCRPIASMLTGNTAMCSDPWYPQTYGVCTQSCGTGNGDCDDTCLAAQASGLQLDCTPGTTGPTACRCSNVGGHTANECQNSANPGYKCCTCKSIRRPNNRGNGWGRGGRNNVELAQTAIS